MGKLAGYGYKTYYAVNWALAILLVGWLVFGAAYEKGLVRNTEEASGMRSAEVFHPFAYTLDTFLPGVDLGEAKLWRPYGKLEATQPARSGEPTVRALAPIGCPDASPIAGNFGGRLTAWCNAGQRPVLAALDWALDAGLARLWLWIEIAMGWVLLGVLAAGLTGVLQRKLE